MEAYPDRKRAAYGMKTSKNRYIDAADPMYSSVGRYMNDCRPADKKKGYCKTNARFTNPNAAGVISIRSTKGVSAGEELFGSYGSSYWRK